MRLFVAMPLPETARLEAAAELNRLRSLEWPVRWIQAEGAHLSLKFFGELTSDRVDAIVEMLNFATEGVGQMAMAFNGASALPTPQRPRVIFLGLDPDPGLELLQDRIERAADRLGFPPEGRPFRPHVTLGRVREGHRLPEGWEAELERTKAGSPFLADRVTLFLSELGPNGPSYRIRHEVRLG